MPPSNTRRRPAAANARACSRATPRGRCARCCAIRACCRSPSTRSRRLKSRRRTATQFTLRRGVSAADLSLLTRQIATLVHSGLPLDEALHGGVGADREAAHPQHRAGRTRQSHGRSRARRRARRLPGGVPGALLATVAAGEQSGHLDTVLETSGGLHREPRAAAQPHPERDAVSGAAVRRVHLDRRRCC